MSERSPQSADKNRRVAVDVEELILGRRVEGAIHDARGVFLLAAGALITPELKRQIRRHGIDRIQLLASDAKRTTARHRADPALSQVGVLPETEATKRLDALVEAAPLEVRDGESPVIVQRPSRLHDYDADMRNYLFDQHGVACRDVAESIDTALAGESVDGNKMRTIAGSYLKHLINDADLVLAVAYEASSDLELADRSLKTSLLSMAIAVELGWSEPNVRDVGTVAAVQEWGLALVPKEIRESTRPLTRNESFELMKHPMYSVDLLENVKGLPPMAGVVAYQMHERIDGSGYPRGRVDRNIHPFAKTIQVADAYVAMTSPRPWRKALTPYAAIECLLRQVKLGQFDANVVRAALKVLSLFPIGSYVALTDGTVAQVRRRDGEDYRRPIVKRMQTYDGRKISDTQLFDLNDTDLSIAAALPTPGRGERRYEPSLLSKVIKIPEIDFSASAQRSLDSIDADKPAAESVK